MGITGVIVVAAVKEAVVKGVAEGEGQTIPGDVGPTARAVSVVSATSTSPENGAGIAST